MTDATPDGYAASSTACVPRTRFGVGYIFVLPCDSGAGPGPEAEPGSVRPGGIRHRPGWSGWDAVSPCYRYCCVTCSLVVMLVALATPTPSAPGLGAGSRQPIQWLPRGRSACRLGYEGYHQILCLPPALDRATHKMWDDHYNTVITPVSTASGRKRRVVTKTSSVLTGRGSNSAGDGVIGPPTDSVLPQGPPLRSALPY
jgi:hypothetical protein